jgi:hypothetical protein
MIDHHKPEPSDSGAKLEGLRPDLSDRGHVIVVKEDRCAT